MSSSPSVPNDVRPTARRVVLVDDDDVLRELLDTALTRSGFEPQVFASGRELLQHLESVASESQMPEAVVVDYFMPDLTGLDVLRELTAAGRNIPTIVMSGSEEHDTVLLAAGARAVLHKPFRVVDLCDVVTQAINDS
ncbi:MAG TPA: response regulator [Ilumatobacter sp.]|nr:response regulator [Ilumatobacter sp.]